MNLIEIIHLHTYLRLSDIFSGGEVNQFCKIRLTFFQRNLEIIPWHTASSLKVSQNVNIRETSVTLTITSLHENKKALSPFYRVSYMDFLSKIFFYDKMGLRLFYFHETTYPILHP